jgi:NACalpha-BTF3-like transcription factor
MESGESQKSSTSTPTIKGVGRKLGKGKPPSPPPPLFNQQQQQSPSSSPGLANNTKAFPYNKKFITLLVEMGFPEEESKLALERSNNDVAAAIDILQGK